MKNAIIAYEKSEKYNYYAKQATFRLNEADINKFKGVASQNSLNHQEAFTSLLNTLELKLHLNYS